MTVRNWPDVALRAIAFLPGLVAYVVCALIAGESSFTSWWFFVGVGIYVGAVFVEHHFTSPQDAIANSTACLGAYLSADRHGSEPLWSLYLDLVVLTLTLALFATLPFEGILKKLAFHWAGTFGRVRVLGGLALMIEFAHRVHNGGERPFTFGVGSALLLVAVSGRWYTAFGRRGPPVSSALSDAVGPSQLLFDGVQAHTKRGDVLTIDGVDSTVEAVVATTLPGSEGPRVVAIPVDGEWTGVSERLDAKTNVALSNTKAPFVGFVGSGSTSQILRLHPVAPLEIGTTVTTASGAANVLYQVTDTRLKTFKWDGSRQIVPIAAARQIGFVDDGFLRLESSLPAPHEKVTLYTTETPISLPPEFTRIGQAAGTSIPVGVARDSRARGHIAILGMTGMGKTTIVERVCQALGAHLTVVALDVTGEYSSRLGWATFDPNDNTFHGCRVHEPSGELTIAAGAFVSGALATARAEFTSGQIVPRLFVFEEAHAMLPEQNIADWDQKKKVGETTRDIMQSRKYGISYIFVSQRTAVISKSALSQCESYIVLRTLDDTSLTYLEAIAGPVVRAVAPSLRRYQALVFGPAFNAENPVVIDLDEPPEPPPLAATAEDLPPPF